MNSSTSPLGNTRFVLYHKEAGVYLGNALGLGFWTNWETAGQPEAVTFESKEDATEHIQSWDETPQDFRSAIEIRPVQTGGKRYATIKHIEDAGMPSWQP